MLNIRFSQTMAGSCCAHDIGGKFVTHSHMACYFLYIIIVVLDILSRTKCLRARLVHVFKN